MAEVLKNNAGFLKFCVPYLKEKKKFVDELVKQLQGNELLAQATAKVGNPVRHDIIGNIFTLDSEGNIGWLFLQDIFCIFFFAEIGLRIICKASHSCIWADYESARSSTSAYSFAVHSIRKWWSQGFMSSKNLSTGYFDSGVCQKTVRISNTKRIIMTLQ